jgi:hypothetical protein
VYRQAEEHKGVIYKARYVACYSDVYDMICRIYRGIGYARKFMQHFYAQLLTKL